jgi:hypothetical protein
MQSTTTHAAASRASEIERAFEILQSCSRLEFFGYTFLGAMPKGGPVGFGLSSLLVGKNREGSGLAGDVLSNPSPRIRR